MRTLFLNPPSFEGFDGGAGSRYQARREIRSFWYPTWLAQAAAITPDSRLVDAPADGLSVRQVLNISRDCDLVIVYTSTPSFANDARTAIRIKEQRPDCLIGFVGPHVTVLPEESLKAAAAVDFVARKEFDFTARDIVEGRPLSEIPGVSWRNGDAVRHNPEREPITDLDSLPFVIDAYKSNLTIENYYIGYLKHPYVSIYTGRGCPAQCTFCLWPQTVSGHTYRVRSPESVCRELSLARDYFPQVEEFFIDDDTFTADPGRAEEIARGLSALSITWSTSSRANVSYQTLRMLRESGLRLLMVGFESGSDEILRRARKGITTETARRFVRDCKDLSIQIHGTFMLGLPGETQETIEQTIRFAGELDPNTVQVSIAAPYPGTELYRQAVENGWLASTEMVSPNGTQVCPLKYEDISPDEIIASVDSFYRRFYFRPKVMARMAGEMLTDGQVGRRRLREGVEFLSFLKRKGGALRRRSLLRSIISDGGPGFCQFAVTDACNARCGFCNFRVDAFPELERSHVDTNRACAALDVLSENGIEYIVFVGGEPTLHPCLADMISHARALGMSTMVCTNGSLLDRDLIERYAGAGIGSIIISIDAADAEVHEHNRGLPGLCSRIAEANRLLCERGIQSTASVALSRLVPDLSALPEFLRSLGFEQVTFSYPVRTAGGTFRAYSDSELIDYSQEELLGLFDKIKKLKRSINVVNPTASIEEMQRWIRGEAQRFPCLAGFKYFHLDWKLDLYRCHLWPEPMCSVFEMEPSRAIRDNCTRCIVDCYRDASVLQHIAVSIHDAAQNISHGCVLPAARCLLSRGNLESVRAVVEQSRWVRKL
jgi:hopanoid biosynthesis associated radical SAM protein HpnJ